MTNDPRRGFLLADVDARNNIELNNTLDATVQYMSIEYLRRKQVAKPHVVFNFSGINTWELMATNRQQSRGCRVSMDWSGEDDIGELRIKPRSYMDASILATGAFSFPVISQSITIREVIDILRGHHAINREMATYPDVNGFPQYHHLADLTEFDFVQPDPINPSLDGCRDFMSVLPNPIHIETNLVLTGLTAVKHSSACATLALSAASEMALPVGRPFFTSIKRFLAFSLPIRQTLASSSDSGMSPTRTFCLSMQMPSKLAQISV